MFDYLVYIGRFQPFHNGHYAVMQEAAKQGKRVIVLVGSAFAPRSTRNPFTFDERKAMIEGNIPTSLRGRINVEPLEDIVYNDTLWIKLVHDTVQRCVNANKDRAPKIGLIGHSKDDSSYYLSLFPNWGSVNVDNVSGVNGTDVREAYYQGSDTYLSSVTAMTANFLANFNKQVEYQTLVEEATYLRDYKKSWESSPFPPTFVTVDAVVMCQSHVLLVERGDSPGKGLFALPGGFINPSETLLNACVRELREETMLKVPEPVIRGSLKSNKTYDDPNRSERGRTITTAFRFDIRDDGTGLPKVKGGDDAKSAFWLPLYLVDRSKMFEDHYSILMDMLAQQP